MNILILGGYGQTGKVLAKHLLKQTSHHLIIAGRHEDRAQSFASSLADMRVSARQVDAGDFAGLRRALDGIDLLLVASPTARNTSEVVRAALEARVDYLDVQLSTHKLQTLRSFEKQILDQGLCFVTEAGFHPGLPSALVRYAASKMDGIQSALTACYINLGASMPYTEAMDELMECFRDYQGQVFKAGRWTKPDTYDVRKFEFGADIGRRDCYSMFFEELQLLPEILPGLRDAGFYMASTGWFLDLVTFLILFGLKIAPRRGLKPLGKVMWWAMTRTAAGPHDVILQVQGSGNSRGYPAQFWARLQHKDAYEFTAIPVVGFLMQFPDIRVPGLHMMGHMCKPGRLLVDMQAMGVKFSEALT